MNFYDDFDTQSAAMIDSIKGILYERHSDIFDRLDFYDDKIYQEPLLYAYLNQENEKWLDSIIYGYENVKKAKIEVFSNAEGVIFLPQIGYFKTDKFESTITLTIKDGQCYFELGGKEVKYSFEPLCMLAFGIELQKYQHPLLESLFRSYNLLSSDFVVNDVFVPHINHINSALSIIKEHNENHFNLIQKTLKRVMLFTATEPNSFATLVAHNMVFLNVNSWDNEMFFVDHLSHEGAHVTFNTITFESKVRLFKVHHNTDFSEVTGDSNEQSSLYLRFHGLFTFYEITKSLRSCMLSTELSEEHIHEAKGRFAFQLRRFKNSLIRFEKLDVFEKEGRSMFDFFATYYKGLETEYGQMINNYDLLMPSYDFNCKAFKEKNPIRSASLS